MKTPRPSTYHRGQHDLICDALQISKSPHAPGVTPYEGVCILLTKLEVATAALKKVKTKDSRRALAILKAGHDDECFSVLGMF